MATKTFLSTGTTWGNAASWSPPGVPVSTDTAVFNASSTACTINVSSTITSINCTGYLRTLTFNKSLTVDGGTFTFGTGMTFVSTGNIHGINITNAGTTIISNNTPLTVPLFCYPDEISTSTGLLVSTNDLVVTNQVYVRGTLNLGGAKSLIFNNSDGSGLSGLNDLSAIINAAGRTVKFTGSDVIINIPYIQNTNILITGTVHGNTTIYQTPTYFTVSGSGDISDCVFTFDQYTGTADFNGNAMQYTLFQSSTITLTGTTPTFPSGFGLSGSYLLGSMILNTNGLDILYSSNVVDKNISIVLSGSAYLNVTALQGLPCTLESNTPGTRFVLTLPNGSTQNINTDKFFTMDQNGVITATDTAITMTDVDCSSGIPLYVIGSQSNCLNVIAKSQPTLGGSATFS